MPQAKVFIVDQPYKAKYKVFFVDQPSQEKNAPIIAGGKLVKNDYEADVKVFIVQQEYQGYPRCLLRFASIPEAIKL